MLGVPTFALQLTNMMKHTPLVVYGSLHTERAALYTVDLRYVFLSVQHTIQTSVGDELC